MVFGASRAVTFAGIFITQAGQLITSADAIAIARFGSGLDGDQRHSRGIVRIVTVGCKRSEALWGALRISKWWVTAQNSRLVGMKLQNVTLRCVAPCTIS